eukprot:CAMPEP_0116850844 /NCGR_PEP_ID=MMETSP0418-20121206/16386_1 /TAXON_ID=1158023 /ORGANISM="Astrosyne radiata, Strain 13vi08-1A" /LENGTH=391 /DNA_ID=CAMNT_0004482787 /DNA_START=325 /DNA_END=1501 /DNA_ORIENTATION=+
MKMSRDGSKSTFLEQLARVNSAHVVRLVVGTTSLSPLGLPRTVPLSVFPPIVSFSADGSALVITDKLEEDRTYSYHVISYNVATSQWDDSGRALVDVENEGLALAARVSNSGSIVALPIMTPAGIQTIVIKEARNGCMEDLTFRLSILFDDISEDVWWSLYSTQYLNGIAFKNDTFQECVRCYGQLDGFGLSNTVEQGCLPQSLTKCLSFSLLDPTGMGGGGGYAAYLYDAAETFNAEEPIVISTGDSVAGTHVLHSNIADCTVDVTSSSICQRDEEAPWFLGLVFDKRRNETAWELHRLANTDDGSSTLVASKDYTNADETDFTNNALESLCLDRSSCYELRMFDAGGDGMCCSFGEGKYFAYFDGAQAFENNGSFGLEQTHSFGNCPVN